MSALSLVRDLPRATDALQVGYRHGHLLVIAFTERKGWWLCRCDCGNEKQFQGCALVIKKCCSSGCPLFHERSRRQPRPSEHHILVRLEPSGPSERCLLCDGIPEWTVVKQTSNGLWKGGRRTPICERCRHPVLIVVS